MPHRLLDDARRRLGLSYMALWIEYFALGGNLDARQLTHYLHGDRPINDNDHNLIVQALNESFLDRGQNHPLAYRSH